MNSKIDAKLNNFGKKRKKNTYLASTIVAKVLLIFQQINIRSLIFNDPDELFFIFFFAKYLRSVT